MEYLNYLPDKNYIMRAGVGIGIIKNGAQFIIAYYDNTFAIYDNEAGDEPDPDPLYEFQSYSDLQAWYAQL